MDRDALTALRVTDDGRIPAGRYTDSALFQLERERVFGACWVIACHASELAPGRVLVREVGGRSVLLTIGEAGPMAMRNVCRHRGSRLCDDDQDGASIVCPVHGWRWDLHGELAAIPDRPGFSALSQDLDLLRLPCAEAFGLVFVGGERTTEPLDRWLGEAAAVLDRSALADWRPTSWTEIPLRANWKTSADMHNEAYHLGPLHPELRGRLRPEKTTLTPLGRHHQIRFQLEWQGADVELTQVCLLPNAQITLRPNEAMLLIHRPGPTVDECMFVECNLAMPSPNARPLERRRIGLQDARLGPMAAADARATLSIAAGLRELAPDTLLHNHRLEAGVVHLHRQLDGLIWT